MQSSNKKIKKDFIELWEKRDETYYIHWTKGEPKTQVQLAFRKHWELFRKIINKLRIKGGNCLEVGCGRGTISSYLSDAGYNCTLLDVSIEVLKNAKKIYKDFNLKGKFVRGDVFYLPFFEEKFDIVFSVGLLEHFKNPKKIIKEQLRILKKEGLFFAYIVPNKSVNIQHKHKWINHILRGYVQFYENNMKRDKEKHIFRTSYQSKLYTNILKDLGAKKAEHCGVYPLPMISHSIEFPFSLMPPESERALVAYFLKILTERKRKYKRNPWICNEVEGQGFFVWAIKKC